VIEIMASTCRSEFLFTRLRLVVTDGMGMEPKDTMS